MTVTIEEVRRREKYWSDHWRAQQNRDKLAFFPSTLAGKSWGNVAFRRSSCTRNAEQGAEAVKSLAYFLPAAICRDVSPSRS